MFFGLAVAEERVLIVVGHPDDESFGMAGTLAQLTLRGADVRVVALSDGVSSRFTHQSEACIQARANRAAHFRAACALLRVHGKQLDVFPDQQADTVPQLEINRVVAHVVDQTNPGTIYTHHVGDLNLDHRRVAEAVLVACRDRDVRLLAMRPEWPRLSILAAWQPTHLESIGHVLDTKVAACACYVDEMRPYPHPRSEQALRSSSFEEFRVLQ